MVVFAPPCVMTAMFGSSVVPDRDSNVPPFALANDPMERSTAQAFAQLILWMEADYRWNRWRAYDLLTHVAELSIGYYAIGTVAAKIGKRYLDLAS